MIKTFPLKMEPAFHKKLEEAAHNARKSLHQYILDKLEKSLPKYPPIPASTAQEEQHR